MNDAMKEHDNALQYDTPFQYPFPFDFFCHCFGGFSGFQACNASSGRWHAAHVNDQLGGTI